MAKKSVKLVLNLGTEDAARYGVDKDKRKEGEVVSVEAEQADLMIAAGLAVEPSAEPPQTAGVEKEKERPGAAQQTAPPDLDAMTKEELIEHAQHHKIEGVSQSMLKDDIIRAIRRAIRRP